MIKDDVVRQSSFNLIHYETAFKVDVFVRKMRPYDAVQLARRRKSVIATEPEASVYVISPEDIILSKLEWYRQGGEVSERQWRDVLGVLKVRADELDLDYLQKWAAELRVHDLLARALQEAGIES